MEPSDKQDRGSWPVQKGRVGEIEPNPYAHLTPEERVGLVWEITRTAWAFRGHGDIDPTVQKHIVRVGRRGHGSDVEALEQGNP